MGNQTSHHVASLTVRFVGPHDGIVEIVGSLVQIMIPGAVITITDHEAARELFKTWVEARIIARRTMSDRDAARLFRIGAPSVHAAVRFESKRLAPMILGKAPGQSPSGCGQVVIKIGQLAIVCDDREAFESQYRLWRSAFDIGGKIWPLMPVGQFEPIAESRITERLFQQGRL